jgi:hypothetical protein
VGDGPAPATERVMLLMHPAHTVLPFTLPAGTWRVALDTSEPGQGEGTASERYLLAGPALCVLVQAIAP